MSLDIFNPLIEEKLRKRIISIKYLSLKRYRQGLDYNSNIPSGAYSVYFRQGKIGIKVIHNFATLKVRGSKAIKTLRKSKAWRDAIKEYKILKRIESSGFTPLPYAVRPVRIGQAYFPAIFMEHIKGVPFNRFDKNLSSLNILSRYKKRLLDKFGVINMDAYGSNVIVTDYDKNRIIALKIIDFSPEMVRLALGE